MDKGCHSVYSMRFHYVCCVKYRRKVLSPEELNYKIPYTYNNSFCSKNPYHIYLGMMSCAKRA